HTLRLAPFDCDANSNACKTRRYQFILSRPRCGSRLRNQRQSCARDTDIVFSDIRSIYSRNGRASREPRDIVTAASAPGRRLLICSCEGTMPLDLDAIRRGCRGEVTAATQLCGAELGRFKAVTAEDGPLTVACTQQATLFSQVAAED